jgi:predicted transcriptional regulator YheO
MMFKQRYVDKYCLELLAMRRLKDIRLQVVTQSVRKYLGKQSRSQTFRIRGSTYIISAKIQMLVGIICITSQNDAYN